LRSDIDQKAPIFAASPEPIEGAPRGDADEAGLLVYMRDGGGWHMAVWCKDEARLLVCTRDHMAVWCEDSWRSKLDLKTILFPSHWMPNPPDVEYAD
jgi:hypothetical protein